MKNKILILIVGLILFLSLILLVISNYCGYEKIPLEIPAYLKESQVSFEREMYYVENLKPKYAGCLDVFREVDRELMSKEWMVSQEDLYRKNDTYRDGEPKVYKTEPDKKFVVVEAFVSKPPKFIRNVLPVKYLILKDQEGKLFTVPFFEFSARKTLKGLKLPGYYQNDKRVGNIDLE